jgi:hypothetical protein
MANSAPMRAALAGLTLTCPANHAGCASFSNPYLANDLFWQNRTFYIGVGTLGSGTLNQQHVVALYNSFTTTQAVTQPTADATTANGTGSIITGGTGACVKPVSYWDIGVRGDTGPGNHGSGFTISPTYSVLTNTSENGTGTNNILAINPTVVSQYCNGSRTPPEYKSLGYQVPPGVADATVPNPIFNLTPSATVDEGNNWINMTWGPLSETNPVTGAILGNYALASSSPAIDYIPTTAPTYALTPRTDFFGHTRPDPSVATRFDVGAIEYQGSFPAPRLTSITPGSGLRGTTVNVTLIGTNLIGASSLNISGTGVIVTNLVVTSTTTATATLTIAPTAAVSSRTASITTAGGISNTVTFTVTNPPAPTLTSITPITGAHGTTVAVTLTGANFTTAGTTVAVSGTGVTVSAVTVVSSTSVKAQFVIASTASLTARTVTVTTPGGTSGAVTFTVK